MAAKVAKPVAEPHASEHAEADRCQRETASIMNAGLTRRAIGGVAIEPTTNASAHGSLASITRELRDRNHSERP
ncbi:MAG: hypothetical protein L0271_15425 [Gemmatimonadetes bacterium]|nr:hypothetical protein [Gemmatimonadota bacterium]